MQTLEEAIAAIEQMKIEHQAEKERILDHNKGLIADAKKAKAAADAAQTAAEEAAEEAASMSGDVEAVRKSLTDKHAKEMKKLNDTIETSNKQLSTLLIDNTINEAIAKNNVLPHAVPLLATYLKNGAQVIDGVAVVGETPLNDVIATYFKSPEATHYVAAPANTGASAPGSTSVNTANFPHPDKWTAEDGEKFMKLSVDNKALANQMADQWGQPHLKS